MKRKLLISLTLIFVLHSLFAQRSEVPFNDSWSFKGQSVSGASVEEIVNIPHSWNKADAQEGLPYYRGDGFYAKNFPADPSWQNKRVFIRFEGVNIKAKVMLNNREVGEHKGGYAAFSFEITDFLRFDQDNVLEVTVNNEFGGVDVVLKTHTNK